VSTVSYTLLLLFGARRGKFGSVCLCTELSSGKTFAAKFIRVRPSQRDEFRHEVTVMNELRHPKILLLWDAFESARELILVMEQYMSYSLTHSVFYRL